MEDNPFDQNSISINQNDFIEQQCNINQDDGEEYVKEYGENENTDYSSIKPSFSYLHLRIDSL